MLLTLIFTIVFSPSGIKIQDNILAYENASLANTILTQGFFLVVSVILTVLGMKPRNWLIHNGVTCTSDFFFLGLVLNIRVFLSFLLSWGVGSFWPGSELETATRTTDATAAAAANGSSAVQSCSAFVVWTWETNLLMCFVTMESCV